MMTFSKPVTTLAYGLVSHYATFDSLSGMYDMSILDLNDFDLQTFAATIMRSNEAYAAEATGADNDAFEKTMLPALTCYLKNPCDKEIEAMFNETWLIGVTSYFKPAMRRLLAEALEEYNEDTGHVGRHGRAA